MTDASILSFTTSAVAATSESTFVTNFGNDLLAVWFVHFQAGLQAFDDEAVYHIATVNILSRDHSWVVVAQGDGALACACARTRNIEHAKAALLIEQEAVIHEVSVDVISRDRPHGVVAFREGALACACACARSIERAEGALARPHEAVKHTVCVDVDSLDLSVRNEAYSECALALPLYRRRGHRTS